MSSGAGRKVPKGWPERKSQIQTLTECCGDDEEQGIELDRLLVGGDTKVDAEKKAALEDVRFSDRDLSSFGPLAEAQFGTVSILHLR